MLLSGIITGSSKNGQSKVNSRKNLTWIIHESKKVG
jgi:hypothetical protein